MRSAREFLYINIGDTVKISDQMFEPVNKNYPEQMNHFFVKDSLYIIKDIYTENKIKKFSVIQKNDSVKRKISIESIYYPIHLLFSKNRCIVKINSIKNNGTYIFFKENVDYPYRKKEDGTFLVLDEKRNQVFLNKNLITKK